MSTPRNVNPWSRPRPTASGSLDQRVDTLERRVDGWEQKQDSHFLWLLGAFAAGFLALAGLMLNRTDATNDRLGARIEAVDTKLSGKLDALDQRLATLSERTAKIETRLPQR